MKAEDLFLGVQGADDAFTGERHSQCFPSEPGLSCHAEPALYLDTLVPRARRSYLFFSRSTQFSLEVE